MSPRSKPSAFHLHWSLALMLVLLSACESSSPAPIPATGTPTLVPPSPSMVTDTPEATLRPTLDPLMSDLPTQAYAHIYTLGYLSPQEQAQVYTIIIRRLAGPDDSFRGKLPKPFLFVMTATDDIWGDHNMPLAVPQGISWTVRQVIHDNTTDLSSEIKWVDSREEVKFDPQHANVIDGVILTLGNILVGDDQRLYIAGGVFYTYAAAQGQTYVFEFQDGQWVLIGRTASMWVA